MNHHYADIRRRIAEPPKWWDENAVPRYCDFGPDAVANIYARQVVLAEIACQACGARFLVAFSQAHAYDFLRGEQVPTLAEQVRGGTLHYGDPPNDGCCLSGPTMNSEPLRVVEFWQTHHQEYVGENSIVTDATKYFEWRRIHDLEIPLIAPWDRPLASPSPTTDD